VPVVTLANVLRVLSVFLIFAVLGLGVGMVAAMIGFRADLSRTAVVWRIGESLFVLLSFILIWFLEAFFCLRCLSNSYGMLKNAKPQWLWNPFVLYNPKSYTAEGAKYARLVLDGMLGATLAAVPILIAMLITAALGMDF
jgi:hypothetical protein